MPIAVAYMNLQYVQTANTHALRTHISGGRADAHSHKYIRAA